jgi:hypothetical protein
VKPTTQAQASVPPKLAVSTAPVRKKPLDVNTAGNEEAVRLLLADASKTGVHFWFELHDSLMWRWNKHAGLGKIVNFPPSIAQVTDDHTRGEDYFVMDDPDDERKARALLTAAITTAPASKSGAYDSDAGSVDVVKSPKSAAVAANSGSHREEVVHNLVSSSEDEGDKDDDHDQGAHSDDGSVEVVEQKSGYVRDLVSSSENERGDEDDKKQGVSTRPWLARPAEGKPFKPKVLLKRFAKWYKQQGDANEVTVKDRIRNAKHLLLTQKVLREGTAEEADRV